MQLNWLYFSGICQLIPLKLWPNTVHGCNHQSTCMPSYSLHVQLLWYPMYYPRGMKARVSPVQWSKPYSIFRILTRAAGFQNHKRWPLHYHCIVKEWIMRAESRFSMSLTFQFKKAGCGALCYDCFSEKPKLTTLSCSVSAWMVWPFMTDRGSLHSGTS